MRWLAACWLRVKWFALGLGVGLVAPTIVRWLALDWAMTRH